MLLKTASSAERPQQLFGDSVALSFLGRNSFQERYLWFSWSQTKKLCSFFSESCLFYSGLSFHTWQSLCLIHMNIIKVLLQIQEYPLQQAALRAYPQDFTRSLK